jgi:hypothetical protein
MTVQCGAPSLHMVVMLQAMVQQYIADIRLAATYILW